MNVSDGTRAGRTAKRLADCIACARAGGRAVLACAKDVDLDDKIRAMLPAGWAVRTGRGKWAFEGGGTLHVLTAQRSDVYFGRTTFWLDEPKAYEPVKLPDEPSWPPKIDDDDPSA
jgi:hypothetical protein